jgi:hypothetical protein
MDMLGANLSAPSVRQTYVDQDELLIAPRVMPESVVASLVAAAERLRPRAVRKSIPGYKASSSVCAFDIRELTPEVDALYKDPTLIATLSKIVGAELQVCPERDPHAVALYYYTQPGDHIGWHFDTSHYDGARYTVLVGVVNRTEQSRLECVLYKKVKDRAPEPLSVSTEPGTMVLFNGDRLWHSVSKLEADAERIILTLEYVTNPNMSPIRRWFSDFKDSMTYFGFRRKKPAGTT